ncbi:MAG: hypothetical protein P1V51_13420, partial [Deltaproteobacteria bacterium]|nr:hypothetical protein [Deltaproteobacteria bacterium]
GPRTRAPGGHELVLALRTDVDPLSPGGFPGVQLAWAHRRVGAAFALLLRPWETSGGAPQRVLGGRLELRAFPWRKDEASFFLTGGLTALDEFFHLRAGLGGGYALGPVRLGLEAAYERLLFESDHFRSNVLVLGLSVGLTLHR